MIDCTMSALSFRNIIIDMKYFLTRFACVLHIFGKCSGLMINVLYSESSSPGSSAGVMHCVVFLGKMSTLVSEYLSPAMSMK